MGASKTLIIFPMVNDRSPPGRKHGHRGKSSFFRQIILIKEKSILFLKNNIMLPGCGVLGCCSRGGVWGLLLGDFGAPGRNDYHPPERL